MSTETARDELALIVHDAQYGESDVTPRYWPLHIHKAADSIQAAGYRKSTILGYVVVDRDGGMVTGSSYASRVEAEVKADAWARDAKASGVDWDYRVAEIVESA